jgi:hypothetical protein
MAAGPGQQELDLQGGSPSKPKEEKPETVSKEEFEKSLATERAERAKLQAELDREKEERIRLEERSKTPAPPGEKVYTRPELDKMVDDGAITEATRDEYLQRQQAQQTSTQIQSEVSRQVNESTALTRVLSQIDRYQELIPDLMDEGSENRRRLKAEYSFIEDLEGKPDSVLAVRKMELKAARAAFGPVDRIKETTAKTRDTHTETGGAGEGGERGGSVEGQPAKGMTADEKTYYTYQIQQGIYKGWDEVNKEYGYKRKRTPR